MTTTSAAGPTTRSGEAGAVGTTAVLDALRHFSLDPVVADRAVPCGTEGRAWERVSAPGDDVEVWVVTWPAGSLVHDLVNHDPTWALSLHAYSPRLRGLTRYELVRGRLEAVSHDGHAEDGLL